MLDREDTLTKILLTILGGCLAAFIAVSIFIQREEKQSRIIVDWNSPQFIGERSGHYSAIFANEKLDEELPDDVLEEFELELEDFAIAHSNDELIRLYGISFKEGTLSSLAVECNTKLFDMCNKYYLTSYGGQQLSPLIPMTIANTETPGRMDQKITYSSLFPSKCVPVSSAESIETMSCLAVLESAETFSQLASDHWTRDRGSLQMNPNYGVGLEAFNSLMGPSEADILANISGAGIDFTGYSAYEPRYGRNITVQDWLDMLSTNPGDRHNVKDSILRVASATQEVVDDYAEQYVIQNDMEAMCLIAMAHNSGNVWNPAYTQRKVGNWRNGTVAYQYCISVTSDKFVSKLRSLCSEKLESARSSGKSIPMTLERSEAKALFNEAQSEGIVHPYGTYIQEGNYYEVTYCYPIQAMYAYMMLGMVFSGK